MIIESEDIIVADGRKITTRLQKLELTKSKEIHCGYCRYHRGENRTYHSPHADIRKIHVRWKFTRNAINRIMVTN